MKRFLQFTKSALIICTFFFSVNTLSALDYYWVGGSGLWSDHNHHWATTSGGSIFHDQVPTSMDNVFFDKNSFPFGGTVTIDQTIIYCHNMDWTGVLNNPRIESPNDKKLWIYGSLTLVGNMQWQVNGDVQFRAFQGGKSITSAGNKFKGNVTFDGVGGGWVLLDAFDVKSYLKHQDGFFNTNDQDVSVGYRFESYGSINRKLHFQNSNVFIGQGNYRSYFNLGTDNFDWDAGTSTIYFKDSNYSQPTAYFNGGNKSFYKLVCEINTSFGNYDNNFHEVTFLKSGTINGNSQFDILTFTPGEVYTLVGGRTQTINEGGIFNGSGNCDDYVSIFSSGSYTTIERSSGAITLDRVVFENIHASGGAVFNAENSVDLGNNDGWNFLPVNPRDLFWVGGGGNWNDISHWALTSGGSGGECIPTSFDNVFFDENSGFSAQNEAVEINVNIAYCNDMDWSSVINTPILKGGTYNRLFVYGSMTLVEEMSLTFSGDVHFRARELGKTITSSGQIFIDNVTFEGAGGSWTLMDAFSVRDQLRHTNGGLYTNNQEVHVGYSFYSSGASSRSLHFGSSNIYLGIPGYYQSSRHFQIGTGTFDFDAGTSNIIMRDIGYQNHYAYFHGGNKTYYNLLGEIETRLIYYNNNFHEVTFLKSGEISGNNHFDALTFTSGGVYKLGNNNTQTINPGGSFTSNGACSDYITINSQTTGEATQIQISSGVIDLDYMILQDVHATGGAMFNASNSADLGNNAGWNFLPSVPRDLYWVGGDGDWNDVQHWSNTSGGAGGACIPTPFDNVIFDQHSGFSGAGEEVYINIPIAFCNNMDWSGVNNTPALDGNTSNKLYVYGSLTFTEGMNLNFAGDVYFKANQPGKTIFSAGKNFRDNIYFDGKGGEWTFLDAFQANNYFYFFEGTINTNDQDLTIGYQFYSSSNLPKVLNLGNSNIYFGTVNDYSSLVYLRIYGSISLNPGGSTIYLTDNGGAKQAVFYGGGKVFNNLICEIPTTIWNNNTFNEVVFEKSAYLRGNNLFGYLTFSPGATYEFSSNTTQTITPLGDFTAEGYGEFPIEIKTTSLGNQATLYKDGDPICLDFLYMTDVKAEGTAFTYAGGNSDDVFNNAGWLFEACPDCFYAVPAESPTLDPNSITIVDAGEFATLIIEDLPEGLEVVWFNQDQTQEVYASTENFFQPLVYASTTYYGAYRDLETGCVSDLLVVDICVPDPMQLVLTCPDNIRLCGAQAVSWVPPLAQDNCGVYQSTSNNQPGDVFEVGEHLVSYSFDNGAGIILACEFTVTIDPLPMVQIQTGNLPEWCQGVKNLMVKVGNIAVLEPPVSYTWSGNAGFEQQITAYENGLYEVTVSDGNGCSSVASIQLDEDYSTLLSAQTIIAGEELEFTESSVLSGGVGVLDAEEVQIQDYSYLPLLRASNASIDATSVVTEYINSDSPVNLPDFINNPYNIYTYVTVPAYGSMTLSGNNYGNVVVGKNATLYIDNPEIYIRSLTAYTGATVIFNQSTNMMIRRKMNIGMMCQVNVGGPHTVIYVGDNTSIAQGSNVEVNIYAPEGLEVSDSGASMFTYMTGMFISEDRISSDGKVIWQWNPGCGGDAGNNNDFNLSAPVQSGIEEAANLKGESFELFPNPVSDVLNVALERIPEGITEIVIADVNGKTLYSTSLILEIPGFQIDLAGLNMPVGLYVLNLRTEEGVKCKRFVKH